MGRSQAIVVVRSIVEPFWAGPSLRTIFMNKNIVGYCGYSDLISFAAYRPDNAWPGVSSPQGRELRSPAQSVTDSAADRLITVQMTCG
jgi:hypothetical protein